VNAREDLSPLERRLVAAVEVGEAVDLVGEGTVDPAEMDGWPAEMDGWPVEREIRAEVIRDVLLGRLGSAADPRGLRLYGVRIVGTLDLEGIRIGMLLRLAKCDFTDVIWMRGTQVPLLDLRDSRLRSLNGRELTVERALLLSRVVVPNGYISLGGARIGAVCTCEQARLRNTDGRALHADRIQIVGDLLLDELTAEGTGGEGAVRLLGAHIDGRVSARGVQLTNQSGPALVADNLQVPDTVDFSHGVCALGRGPAGAVRLVGARVGSISFGGARLDNPDGPALALHYADVAGTVYLDGVRARGMVRLAGARVGGRLDLVDAQLDGSSDPAFDGTRLQAAQGMMLRGAVLTGGDHRRGSLQLRSARIGGDLDIRAGRLRNERGLALRLSQATVQGPLIMTPVTVEAGGVSLRDASVGALHDDPSDLDAGVPLWLDGLTYRGIPGDPEVRVTVRQRIGWLRRMDAYAAQPYRQLAAAYQAAGHEEEARRLLVAQQEHLRDSGLLTGWARRRHRLLGVTLGYGYQSWRAVAGLLATIAVAIVLLVGAGSATTRAGAGGQPAAGCPVVERIGLAIDATVPLVDTGSATRCTIAADSGAGQAVLVVTWVLRLLGWAFATLVVAGYTGLVRRG
jgi:hypothetical protein